MDIKEKAIEYAKGRELTVLEQALADAYVEGYNAALADIEAKNDIGFIDLGLPSGTLWSNYYLLDNNSEWIVYEEAKKFNLPSQQQWDELVSQTRVTFDKDGIYFKSTNGRTLKLPHNAHSTKDSSRKCVSFWLRTDDIKNERAYHYTFYLDEG